jgi:ABC-type iron transport system FetAB ATPase subunit
MQTTPNVQLLDEIASKIDKAKTRIYVEVYIFTEKRMKKALVDAKKR